jgi:hypothetical protein
VLELEDELDEAAPPDEEPLLELDDVLLLEDELLPPLDVGGSERLPPLSQPFIAKVISNDSSN